MSIIQSEESCAELDSNHYSRFFGNRKNFFFDSRHFERYNNGRKDPTALF